MVNYCKVCGTPIFSYKRENDDVCSLSCYLISIEDKETYMHFFEYEDNYDKFLELYKSNKSTNSS